MKSISAYNVEKFLELQTDLRESRLKKAFTLLASEPAGTLLDIGCGRGSFSAKFLPLGCTVYGIDLTDDQIRLARESGINAVVHDLSAGPLPFGDEFFDLVFAGEVIEHVIDTTAFLKELHRVLKPGGCAVVTTPNLASFENRCRLLVGSYPKWLEYKLEEGQGHVRLYTPRTLREHFVDNGFLIEKMTGNWVPFIPQHLLDDIKMPSLALTGDLLPSLAMDIILKVRKRGS